MEIINFYKQESLLAQDTPLDDLQNIRKICSEMEDLCIKSKGIGLAAAQVGIPCHLFVLRADNNSLLDPPDKFGYYVNCKYEGSGQKILSLEACLSLKDEFDKSIHYEVERFEEIRIIGKKLRVGKKLEIIDIDRKINYFNQGVVFQHEIDHGYGILISNIGKLVKDETKWL